MAKSKRATVDCPTCDAFKGEPCRDDSGRFRQPHRLRRELMLALYDHGGHLPDHVYEEVMESGVYLG